MSFRSCVCVCAHVYMYAIYIYIYVYVCMCGRYEREGSLLAIVSMYDGIDPGLKRITHTNKRRYAKKYGHVFYDMSINELPPLAKQEGPLYAKLYAVEKALNNKSPRHEWVMWSDADRYAHLCFVCVPRIGPCSCHQWVMRSEC
jgi:hypothetical protein